MNSSHFAFFLFSLFLFSQPTASNANLRKTKLWMSQLLSQTPSGNNTPVLTTFEVTKPIKLPNTKPCSSLVLEHDFGFTYGQPPAFADYKPPKECLSQNVSKIVLELTATCKGTQFDRIFGVWLGGVEILRSCTAEPGGTGVVWTVKKDVTRYSSLFKEPQTLAVYLGSLIDATYTGVYHVNITLHLYPVEQTHHDNLGSGYGSPADLILPISRNLPLKDALWFSVQNSKDVQLKEFSIPKNVYRAVLEVYVSPHQNDEFWYTHPPNADNGAFREVVVSLDDKVVGVVFPFTVIYTGGINPLLWRPITAIGSFDLPSYDIEITPFLGSILDGKQHKFGFGVTNSLNVWYIDANLHVWLDSKSVETKANLIEYTSTPLNFSSSTGINGTFFTTASRSISSSGWVESSHGKIQVHSIQDLSFVHDMEDGDLRIVNQIIESNHTVLFNHPSYTHTQKLYQSFPLYLYTDDLIRNNTDTLVANVSIGFIEKRGFGPTPVGFSTSALKNVQNGHVYIGAQGNSATSAVGSTQQVYKYDGAEGCFFRNVSSSNYAVLSDISGSNC